MTAERIQMAEETQVDDEAKLKSEIKALEKRINSKQSYINKLQDELRDLKFEQFELKQKRIKLLQRELAKDDMTVAEGLKSVTN